jgi:riboflavin kinase
MLYARLFEKTDAITLSGTVKTGLGEGRYYLSRPGYKTQFHKVLGWDPYPGTLNLELTGPEANKLRFLRKNPVYTIEAFQAEGRTFGGVTCHPAHVTLERGSDRSGKDVVDCAAILPHRSHYTTTIELIAPVRLRDAIPCVDGQRLEVVVDLQGRSEAPATTTAVGKAA